MTQGADGSFSVKSCTAVDAGHVSIASPDTPAVGVPSSCVGGVVLITIVRPSDGATGNFESHLADTYAGTSANAVDAWHFANTGGHATGFAGTEGSGGYTAMYGGELSPGTYTRSCLSGDVGTQTPFVAGVSQLLPVSFPVCDAAESYTDSLSLFGLALVSLVIVWGLKNFVYKLVANQ